MNNVLPTQFAIISCILVPFAIYQTGFTRENVLINAPSEPTSYIAPLEHQAVGKFVQMVCGVTTVLILVNLALPIVYCAQELLTNVTHLAL